MKKCCKKKINWKHNGTKEDKQINLGACVMIRAKSYITCIICDNKMFLTSVKTLLDAK